MTQVNTINDVVNNRYELNFVSTQDNTVGDKFYVEFITKDTQIQSINVSIRNVMDTNNLKAEYFSFKMIFAGYWILANKSKESMEILNNGKPIEDMENLIKWIDHILRHNINVSEWVEIMGLHF